MVKLGELVAERGMTVNGEQSVPSPVNPRHEVVTHQLCSYPAASHRTQVAELEHIQPTQLLNSGNEFFDFAYFYKKGKLLLARINS
jgi:hypothetical protein